MNVAVHDRWDHAFAFSSGPDQEKPESLDSSWPERHQPILDISVCNDCHHCNEWSIESIEPNEDAKGPRYNLGGHLVESFSVRSCGL